MKFFLAEKHWNIPHKLGSLLHIAAAIGHLNIVKFLIKDLKYDPNSTDCDQLTPLHRACQGGQVEITKFLVFDSMVDINVTVLEKRSNFAPNINFELGVSLNRAISELQNGLSSMKNGQS